MEPWPDSVVVNPSIHESLSLEPQKPDIDSQNAANMSMAKPGKQQKTYQTNISELHDMCFWQDSVAVSGCGSALTWAHTNQRVSELTVWIINDLDAVLHFDGLHTFFLSKCVEWE